MSKSQIKRLHEQQELEKVAANAEEVEDVPVARKGPANRFAFLDDDDDNKSDSEQEKKQSDEEDEPVEQVPSTSTKKKKRNKKNKKNGKKYKDEENDDEFYVPPIPGHHRTYYDYEDDDFHINLADLLRVDPKLFDPTMELKRALGKTFRDVTGNGAQNSRNSSFRPAGRIIKSKPTWPPYRNLGLSMVLDETKQGYMYFKFTHTQNYEALERDIFECEHSGSLDMLQAIWNEAPYHLNSLLILAQMHSMQENLTMAIDLIERGIFYCEQNFCAKFQPFTFGHCMSYDVYENRAFFLLLHHHMRNCVEKHCFETALNVAKFIFKLDPLHDNMGILLYIDTLSIKARQYEFLELFYEAYEHSKNLQFLPNMVYSRAMAQYLYAKDHKDIQNLATQRLIHAIRSFPTVVTSLLDELQIHPDPLLINHRHFSAFASNREPVGLRDLIKIYVKLSADLWREPTALRWLEETTRSVAEDVDDAHSKIMNQWKEKRPAIFTGRAINVTRLAAILGYDQCDSVTNPCPPPGEPPKFLRAAPTVTRGTDSMFVSFIRSMYPDYQVADPGNFGAIQAIIERARLEFQRLAAPARQPQVDTGQEPIVIESDTTDGEEVDDGDADEAEEEPADRQQRQ
ncbi:unnamed protein product [Caenorhabditis bovis]|uniref:Transcription factor 25 n=1 Tax=Caenorhabditis bovis TaxID=2654633 RepID=A0A8S1F843_9PELO|nr:unnamed protein product [Caenorhabditis bovis]